MAVLTIEMHISALDTGTNTCPQEYTLGNQPIFHPSFVVVLDEDE